MPVNSFAHRLRKAVSRFAGADQGNIAETFCIALAPVLTFIGAAADYSRCVTDRDKDPSVNHDVVSAVPTSLSTQFIADQDQGCPAAKILPAHL
jgi:hypothetical protein